MTRFRIALGVVLLLIAALVVFTVVRSPMPATVTGSASGDTVAPVSERPQAPDFTGIDAWINSPPLTLASLHGHVVLVDFWTFSCVNCVRTIPHLQQLVAEYADKGLVVVGVHSPEFDFEKVVANVQSAVRRLGVTWPVAVDSQMATWNAYQNEYWPAEYLIDQQGRIAYTNFGEGNYAETDQAVAQLLGITAVSGPVGTPVPEDTTPELYAGSDRGQLADGAAYGTKGQAAYYPDHGPPAQDDAIQVTGSWIDEGQYLVAASAGHVRLNFQADSVYVVAGTESGHLLSVEVSVDGAPVPVSLQGPADPGSRLTVSREDLFHLITGEKPGYNLIDLTVPAGFELYTFTFG
ncbi:MAG: redoxin domain-containing protein [Candidatus Dormibacteraeota bacterium]|nr:redoxin domain-containing protein [Candidatus Dormibacteraeota bacterium]